jgi:hypothetical protein
MAFTDGEVLGTSFKQRVLCGLCGFTSAKRRSGRFLSCSFLDGRLVIETGASAISHGRTVDNAWFPGALMLDAPKCIRAQQNAS